MEHKAIRSMLLIGGLAFGAGAFAGGPSPAMLSNTCAGCHGTDGSSVGPASPTISGMSEQYFIDSMVGFKNGDRPSTIMDRIAKGYSDDEIAAMAKFFGERPFVRMAQEHDAGKAAKGKKIHKKYCEKCHEDGGMVDDESGVLAGQWIPYLRYTMDDFNSGARDMSKKMKKRMKKVMDTHGEAGMEALVQYYGSQK